MTHPDHPTPPAPGEAREAPWYDEWLRIVAGTPGDGLHYVAPQQARGIQDAIAALRARAEAAERARDEAETARDIARGMLDAAEQMDAEVLAVCKARAVAAEAALRAILAECDLLAMPATRPIATLARAALAPAPETTP